MDSTEQLEARIAKLEKQSPLQFFVQYLLSPLLILLVGTFINWRIERDKAENERIVEHDKAENQRVELAQKMIPPLFQGNPDQAIATERLLSKVVDKDLAAEFKEIVEKYYSDIIAKDYKKGDVEAAEKKLSSVTAIGGDAANQVIQNVKPDRENAQRIQNLQLKSLTRVLLSSAPQTAKQAESEERAKLNVAVALAATTALVRVEATKPLKTDPPDLFNSSLEQIGIDYGTISVFKAALTNLLPELKTEIEKLPDNPGLRVGLISDFIGTALRASRANAKRVLSH